MAALKELTSRRAQLNAEIERLQAEARSEAIAQIKVLMGDYGLGPSDIAGSTPAKREPSKVAAKYKDPATGNTWSGRGLKPKWLRAAIDGGASLDSFKV